MKIFTCRRQLMFVVCLLLGCLSIQAADDGLITEQVTLNGVVAGSLPTIITDDNKNLITNLKINGEINGTDLKFIREMAGRSVSGDETEGKLSILDLSDTKIVSGGKRYFHDMVNGASYFTKDDEIGDNAFYQCSGLKSLTFPNGLTEIGDGAFWECRNLTSLTLPSSLTSTGRYISSPFLHCNQLNDVRYIIYDDLATYVQKKHPKMHIPLDIIKYYLNDQEITSLEIPEGVTIIGENAFQKCSDLTSLTLPDGITSIGENAFLRCTGLTSLTFPSSLTKIGDNAFCECYGLKSLTLPDGITEINSYTFATCLNLTSLTLSANLTSISLGGFKGCFALKNLTIPSGLTSLSNLHITDISTTIESVYVSSSVPATAGSFFDGVDLSNCTLYVPKGMIWNYKLADVWKNFGKIIEYDTTGVDKVTTRSDVKEISRFSLAGQRLAAPTKGMNIVVYSDGSIKKVAVQ